MNRIIRLLSIVVIASLIIYSLFPKVAGYVYMSNTDAVEIEEKRNEYWKLTDYAHANRNNFNSPDFYERRMELIVWMRVRYLDIDEGHIPPKLVEKWKVLFEYWRLKSEI